METLPDALVFDILKRINKTADRNAVSMVSTRLCSIEADQRYFLRVGYGLNPAAEALTSLCIRFPNLTKIELDYSGWMSRLRYQLNNEALLILSSHCLNLTDLTISFCWSINDTGFAHLASCKSLRALKLTSVNITSNGLFAVVVGCKNLSALSFTLCNEVSSVEWLEYIGNNGNLECLSVKNCAGLGENDLIMLGPGWKKLGHLELDMGLYNQYQTVNNQRDMSSWNINDLYCDKLKELSLEECDFHSGSLLSYVLRRCEVLESLFLVNCRGLDDTMMIALSQRSCKLRKFSLHQSTGRNKLSDNGLKELGHGCSMLEEFELLFIDEQCMYFRCFTQHSLCKLIQGCPLRVLALTNVLFFNDFGMEALCSAHFLEVLELVRCQEVSDEGLRLVIKFPSLKSLKLSKCLGLSDDGLEPLMGSGKLDSLIVEDCVQISEKGVKGAAKFVSYKQDLSWMLM